MENIKAQSHIILDYVISVKDKAAKMQFICLYKRLRDAKYGCIGINQKLMARLRILASEILKNTFDLKLSGILLLVNDLASFAISNRFRKWEWEFNFTCFIALEVDIVSRSSISFLIPL